MSVYSGFAKRNAEEFYDQLTYKLVEILAEKVISASILDGKHLFLSNIAKRNSEECTCTA